MYASGSVAHMLAFIAKNKGYIKACAKGKG